MRVIRGVEGFRGKRPVVSLGNFDGIHLGHQLILTRLVERAGELECPSVVYTFDPHPLKVVAPERSPALILDLEDKLALIDGFGVDYLVLARFTRQFASRHPREFVEDVLVKGLGAAEVWVGSNFSFGRGKKGNVEALKGFGGELGFSVTVTEPLEMDGAVVSSSRVRAMLAGGDVKRAALLLDKFYSIKGTVVKGQDVGRELGFPTANLEVSSELTPGHGVYAAFALIGDRKMSAVVNIGTAPTIGRGSSCVEVHLLDFSGDLYGKRMTVSFIERLRSERAFSSREELSRQITKDTEKARKVFSSL